MLVGSLPGGWQSCVGPFHPALSLFHLRGKKKSAFFPLLLLSQSFRLLLSLHSRSPLLTPPKMRTRVKTRGRGGGRGVQECCCCCGCMKRQSRKGRGFFRKQKHLRSLLFKKIRKKLHFLPSPPSPPFRLRLNLSLKALFPSSKLLLMATLFLTASSSLQVPPVCAKRRPRWAPSGQNLVRRIRPRSRNRENDLLLF